MIKTTVYDKANRKRSLFIMIVWFVTTIISIQTVLAQSTYYVGGTGALDSNPGTSTQPFLTIQKAATVAATGSVVNIRAGTYRETITPASIGITFQPDQGATVTISGLEEVGNTNWSVHTGNIYKKTITLPVNGYNVTPTNNVTLFANQVFRNGVMMHEARWPKVNGFADLLDQSKFQPKSSTTQFTSTNISDQNLSSLPNLQGAKVLVNGWFYTQTSTISNHSGNQITFPAIHSNPWFRKFYYVTGKLNLLTQAKEWHYEVQNGVGVLYFFQEGGGSPTGVEYKARNYGFDLRGISQTTIKGLTFIGCEPMIGNTSSASTVIENIRASYMNHAVVDLEFEHPGYGNARKSGMKLIGANSVIRNSELSHSASTVIWLGANCTAENNLIHDVGYEGNWGAPINLYDKDGGQIIKYNTFYRTGRSCVDFGAPITPADGQHLNVEISYNHFYDFGLLNWDLGAIYAHGQANLAGTRVHHNWIHDNHAEHTPGVTDVGIQTAIYFDQASGPATVDHNVTWLAGHADFYHEVTNEHRPSGTLIGVYNNTFATLNQYGSYVTHVLDPNDPQRNNIYRGPIVIDLNSDTDPGDIAYSVLPNQNVSFVGPVNTGLGYRLSPSPNAAIDQGTPLTGITDGSIGAPDIGAYEYGGEAWVAGNNGPVGPNTIPPGGTTTYEAETAALAGTAVVNSNHTGFSGTGFVAGFVNVGASVSFSVNAASAGSRTVTLRYANGNAASTLSLYLNGVKQPQLALPTTSSWSTWADKTSTLTLNAGVNTIMYRYDAGDAAIVNLDYIAVSGDAVAPTAPTNLASPSKTNISVNLTWTASTDNVGVTGYEIYNGATLLTSIAPATSHNVTGLTANTAYVFTVKAKDAANNLSAASNTLNVTTDASSTSTKYEAEAGTLAGTAVVNTNHTGFSGTGFVAGFVNVGASVSFSVNVASAGSRTVTLRYANGNAASTLSLYLNGVKQPQLALPTTSSWSTWADKTSTLTLNAGVNTIMYRYDAGDAAIVNLDYIAVSGDAVAPTAPTNLASPSKTNISVNLTWTASTDNVGVTGYEIYNGATLLTSIAPATSHNVTGLTANTAYVFTVKAKDAANNLSAASNTLNVTTDASSTSTKYEAEAGTLAGTAVVNTNHTGFSGTGFVAGFVNVGASVSFSVNVASAGSRTVTLRYANGNAASTLSLYLNGVKQPQLALPTTSSWSTWADKTSTLTLNAGVNTIMYRYDAGDAAIVNLDYITVSGDAVAPTAPTNLASPSKTNISVNLTWTASTDNVGVTGYEIYNGATLLTSIAPATSHNVTGLTANTAYVFTVKAKDAANNLSAASNTLNVTTDALPFPWLSQDIGSVGVAGSASYSAGTFTVDGSGTDIWGTADQFRFVYRSLSGDGEIIARVASIENVDSQSKAGAMIRETLTVGSKHALINLAPVPQHQFLWRSSTSGTTSAAVAGSGAAPVWVKLKRVGNSFSGYTSSNGTTWTQIGATQTVTMASNVYIGLAVLAKNNTTLNTSTFDNVALNDGNGNPMGRMAFSTPISEDDGPTLEKGNQLFQNIPNPYQGDTEIRISLEESVKAASVVIYDMNGKVLKNIELSERGDISIPVTSRELNSGMYLYSLFINGKAIDIKRMILTK